MPDRDSHSISSAAVLEPSGVFSLDLGHAMDRVVESLSRNRAQASEAFGVLVFSEPNPQPKLNFLTAARTFVTAYMRGWGALSRITSVTVSSPDEDHLHTLEVSGFHNVKFFVGKTAISHLKENEKPAPGIYIMAARLNSKLLNGLDLPPLPERFRGLPLVIQVGDVEDSVEGRAEMTRTWIDWGKTLESAEEGGKQTIARDTLEWRQQFMAANPSWTAAEVAAESASTARNRAAIASRWLQEGKIFAVKYQGQQHFPSFQFQDGNPIPVVAQIIREFPEHASGWDLAYFFVSANQNIAGRKPLELLKSKPERVQSLAKAFVHPADVF